MTEGSDDTILYRYTFLLGSGQDTTFELRLDRQTLALKTRPANELPDWTRLACCKCPNCPLNQEDHPHCPIAANIVDLVDFFTYAASYEKLGVRIETSERSYVKHTTTTEAVSSLLGIYMVTSGCPVMDKLRPMVRFHLPLATTEETMFRAMAMYLVAQYFVHRRGGEPDWELRRLPEIYREIGTVNRSFVDRLHETAVNDASINAVIRLDTFASSIVMSADLDQFEALEGLFKPYLT